MPLSRFPKVTQDITLKITSDLKYQDLYKLLSEELDKNHPKGTVTTLEPLGIFQKDDDKAHKNITFRLTIVNYERTMTDQEVTELLDKISLVAKENLKATRV